MPALPVLFCFQTFADDQVEVAVWQVKNQTCEFTSLFLGGKNYEVQLDTIGF